ncbi:hypothetical protein HHI36_002481 [Cryptolaemus montrouzieri]|uniref:Uncharacterized protein n=1 Tax=Cryptolaemus montrouzieri TaxID=559131 RepID=A0ABD2PAR4_9CUCU
MALLNLMRFVVLQQKSDNLNNFKNVVKIWREIYLDPLSELLEDSQAVFKKKKSEIEHEMSPHDEPQLSFSVGEEETLEVSKFEKLQSIDLTLTGFEMIGSLLDRLIELLKLKNCY